ncbi:MAG: DUF3644 domain-containing protein, partial [Propionibacteriaceae bacterium]|nr:DUF3644 domain-containing protein [Propionibacteriaceae bacterium]
MSAPYISHKRLAKHSMAAMVAAIEIYNKPQILYRDELTVILIVNSWELALKAALRKGKHSIHYRKKRKQPYRSIGIDDALRRVTTHSLWPKKVDGKATTVNIQALTGYRDCAIHLYNTEGLGAIIYPFLQQTVLNYRDFMEGVFKQDLADSITWQLLPLGVTAPPESIQFMKVDTKKSAAREAEEFLEYLRKLLDHAEAQGADLGRVAAIYDIHLTKQKRLDKADLQVAITDTADGRVVLHKIDPNHSHPYRFKDLLLKVNEKRSGRQINSHDLKAIFATQKEAYSWGLLTRLEEN